MQSTPTGSRWHGSWIAPDVPDFAIDPQSIGGDLPPAGFSRSQFRRSFHLTSVPASAALRISADSRYLLWVNGVEIGRGPIRSQPRRLRYDEYDIAPALRVGDNSIAVLVTYYGNANSFWQPAASSGLLGRDAQLVAEVELDGTWLVTDDMWRTQRSPAWRSFDSGAAMNGVPVEMLDARLLDPAWIDPGFDDSGWSAATILRASHDGSLAESRPPLDPYGALLPRGIAHLGGESFQPVSARRWDAPAASDLTDHPAERVITQLKVAGEATPAELPLTITPTPEVTVVQLDFGRIVAGHVEFEVEAPSGVRIDLHYQESADYDAANGPVASAPRSSASYTTRGTDDVFRATQSSMRSTEPASAPRS